MLVLNLFVQLFTNVVFSRSLNYYHIWLTRSFLPSWVRSFVLLLLQMSLFHCKLTRNFLFIIKRSIFSSIPIRTFSFILYFWGSVLFCLERTFDHSSNNTDCKLHIFSSCRSLQFRPTLRFLFSQTRKRESITPRSFWVFCSFTVVVQTKSLSLVFLCL